LDNAVARCVAALSFLRNRTSRFGLPAEQQYKHCNFDARQTALLKILLHAPHGEPVFDSSRNPAA
jgi:hypothetical protein